MVYKYTESGLDNVYLKNGYTIHKTPYGEGVSIQDTDGLHRVIGQWLISQPTPIIGAELRFLRMELDMTQKNLAAILGTTEQTLRLWEKHRNKSILGSADKLLRALYGEYLNGAGMDEAQIERLLNPIKNAKAVSDFRNTLVHAMWSVQPDGTVLAVRLQARGEFNRSRLPVSA